MTEPTTGAPPLLAWLEAQIAADEQTGRAASGHHEPEHWRWECWHDDTVITPDAEDEFLECPTCQGWNASLRSVEQYPSSSLPGTTLPTFALSRVEEVSPAAAGHIATWDPARVAAECAAKRRVLTRHALERRILTVDSPDDLGGGTVTRSWDVCVRCTPNTHITLGQDIVQWPCPDVLDVAVVYQDRDGWQEGWAPRG